MKEKLIQYVDLIFAGTKDCEDMKQEILQNTLDRYDDLICEGKSPEAAYRLAIIGIGDINEILGTTPAAPAAAAPGAAFQEEDTPDKKKKRALAVALYILCPVPLLILGNLGGDIFAVFGVSCMLGMVAYATYLLVINSKEDEERKQAEEVPPLLKSVNQLIWAVGLAAYFLVSFLTRAWFVTWIIFPLTGALQGLVKAIFDFKEATKQ